MPRGNRLSEFEKGQITAYHNEGKSNREIARLLDRGPDVVGSYLRDPNGYGKVKRPGRPSKLSGRDKRRIYRAASNSTSTSTTIKRELGLAVHSRTIRRAISKNSNLVRRKMKRAPALTDDHRRKRVEFASQNMDRDWSKVRGA